MKKIVFYQNQTPLHMGTGTEIGFVDLPIQREKTTGFPKGEASGIKGAFRKSSRHQEWFGEEIIDGKEDTGAKYKIGEFCFTDARILFLPVREYSGEIFVWITCPFVLKRFLEEAQEIWPGGNKITEIEKTLNEVCGKLNTQNSVRIVVNPNDMHKKSRKDGGKISLEELDFQVENTQLKFPMPMLTLGKEEFLKEKMETSLYLLDDSMFAYFCDMSTEVQTRIRIGENGVVENGGLFEEEFLPEYSVLYNFIEQLDTSPDAARNNSGEKEKNHLEIILEEQGKMIQLGGGSTLGKGITWFWYYPSKEESGR